jgi:predicted phage baseplate assembly protein
MSEIWWGKESSPRSIVELVRGPGSSGNQPRLLPGSRPSIEARVRDRIKSFTPQWTNLRADDAGIALIRLFGEQMEPVIGRLNRLPEKALVDFLNIAGVEPLPATAATALLEFEVSDGATESVLIAEGFQVAAQPADDSSNLVIFETERSLFATPAKIAEMHVQQGSIFQAIDFDGASDASPFLPLGKRPTPGYALWIGLSGDVAPGPTLSLGIRVYSPPGPPPAVPAGGVAPIPVPSPPLLRWDVLDGTSLEPAEVITDQTGGLVRSGLVELQLPRRWRTGRPAGLDGDEQLRWLRLRLAHGQYPAPPRLSFVKINVTQAIAARTIRDEVLEPVSNSDGRRWRLSQTPILPGSLILQIDEGGIVASVQAEPGAGNDSTGNETEGGQESSSTSFWREVSSLSLFGAEEKVYVLEPASGEVTFGNGITGAAVPPGFRHVRALSYRVGGGRAGAVDAEAANTLISSAPFLASVKNPLPASGGTDREDRRDAMRRGPEEIRARERAVTVADYDLLARRAPGAQVKRARAISGWHPSFPGSSIPGVVGVFVVPPDRNEGPPTPDQQTLRAVAEFLSRNAAPSGVEVVAAAPRYHTIRAEAGVIVRAEADAGATVQRVFNELNRYLHPLNGGDDGEGWPFGGTLHYTTLLRLVTNVEGVSAVSRLNFLVDGFRLRACSDFAIAPDALFWPEGHQVIVLETEVRL